MRVATTKLEIDNWKLIIAPLCLLAMASCKPSKPEMKKYSIGEQGLAEERTLREEETARVVVAEVGGYPVTVAEVEKALQELPPFQRFYYSSPEKIEIFLQNYTVLHLLAALAVKEGLDADAKVRGVLEDLLAEKYRQVVLAEAVKPSEITAEEVESFISARKGAGEEEMTEVRARALILADMRAKAWERHLARLGKEHGLQLSP